MPLRMGSLDSTSSICITAGRTMLISCRQPAVMQPGRWVVEEAEEGAEAATRSASRRRALGMASHQVHVGSRSRARLVSAPLVAATHR
jgi:hypothetical protein